MPFKSDSQRKLCYLLKGKGQAGSWDCDEWSAATGKKKLPEHVEDQTEKKALEATNKIPGGVGDSKKPSDFPKGVLDEGVEEEKEHTTDPDIAQEIATDHLFEDPKYYTKLKKIEKMSSLSAIRSLCSLWASPSPIKEAAAKSLLSKLSSVVTSPGRGSGDIEESAVDPDPFEGMQKAKPMPARMGHRGVNKFVSPKGAARNALMRATKDVFGEDLNNRGIKTAGEEYQRVFNPIKQRMNKLKAQGKQVTEAAGGNGASGTSQGVIQQDKVQQGSTFTPAATVNKNPTPSTSSAPPAPATSVNKNPTPSASSAPPPPAAPIQPAAKPADSGSWFTPADKTKQTAQATSAAAGTVGTAFSAAMGNQDSLQTLNNDANRPNLTAAGDKLKAMGDNISSKFDAFKKRTTDTAAASAPAYIALGGSPLKIQERADFINKTLPQAAQTASVIGNRFAAPVKPITRAASSVFNDYAANSEGRRVAAGYALPVANWMNANPWAKYLGGAALGGLGLYGINKLMGGGNKNKGTGSTLDQNFRQGLASQQPR